jgi:hypothetical protein
MTTAACTDSTRRFFKRKRTMTHRNTWIGTFFISLGLLGLVTAKAHEQQTAAPAATIEKSFTVDAVSLRDLDAALRIDTYDGTLVLVKATGSRRAIDGLRTTASRSALEITQPEANRTAANVVHVERNIVINRGGSSTVIIGGTPASGTRTPEPLRLQIMLPRRVPLTVTGYTGRADIGRLSAPTDIELLSGHISIARTGAARLAIIGGGEIEVARADGALDLAIAGSGEIAVKDGAMPSLTLDTTGTSTVSIGGRVGTATLSLNGVSDVSIAHVDQEPAVDANGVTSVDVGNW